MRTVPTLTLSVLAMASLEAMAALSISVPPAWLKAEIRLPAQSRSPLVVRLSPDMAACRARYGKEAAQKCSRQFGLAASRVAGVSMTSSLEGVWRWESPGELAFTPEDPWPERTSFQIDLSGLRLPSETTLSTPRVDFTTPPLTMTAGRASFWIDPAVSGERALTIDAVFSTAVADTKAFEASVAVDVPEQSGIAFASPVFIWNHDRTGLYLKLPVRTLGKAADVRVVFPKAAAAWTAQDGRHPIVKPGFEKAAVSFTVPAADALYKIGEATLSPKRTETLEQAYELTLRTSLLTKPSDLAAALRVTALPARLNEEAVSPTDWRRAPAVTPDILKRGAPVSITIDQDPDTPSDRIRFLLRAKPGDFLHLSLPAGFGPDKSATLDRSWSTVLSAADPGAAVGFLQPGSMMTLSGARTLTLMADGVDRIRWRIERIRDPYLALTAQNWRAHETVAHADALAESAEGVIPVAAGRRFFSLSLDEAALPGGRAGLFQIMLTGEKKAKDGSRDAWNTVVSAAKRVLVTDTALIAKTGCDGSHVVYAADLARGAPAEGLRAELLGANGVPLEAVETDASGAARFATTRGLEREKAPAAIVVTNEATGDLAWLSLADASNVDGGHDFSTAGRLVSEDGLTGLVFSERGIYRPGETLHAGLIVKTADWHKLPAGLPVTLRITDAAGRTMLETAPPLSPEGTAGADWTIPADALPGDIRLDLLAGDAVLSTHHAAIGDFTPEAMRLSARVDGAAPGWMKPSDLRIEAALSMSYGAAAADKAVRGRLVLSPARSLKFPGLAGWTFVDPTPFEGALDDVKVKAVQTDASGRASLTLPLSAASGTLQGRLLLEGFENGGIRAATENVDFLLSPADAMLGWRRHADSDLRQDGIAMPASGAFSWIRKDEARTFEFLLVDRFLKPCAGEPLTVAVMARQSVTELAADSTGRLRYDERSVERPISESSLVTDANGRTTASLDTSMPGDFSLVVKDGGGRILARLPYRVAGEDLRPALAGDLPSATAKLVTNKSTYESGESMQLDIVSPFEGLALVTLEADRVLAEHWARVKPGTNRAELRVPEGYSGRAFASASLVRASKDAARFLKAYARTIEPVSINMSARTLGISLEAPDTVADARALKVTVKTDVPARVFLWAVDTGILSLTGYRTPSPVHALLEDRALQVDTRQTLEGLMPEGMKLPGEAPFGGGFALKSLAADAMANPFRRTMDRAAVWWAGSLETDSAGRTATVSLPPEFNGGVRLMAAGAAEGRAGAASIETAVRAPWILTPILPGFAAPGDVFTGVVSLNGEAPWKGVLTLGLPEALKSSTLSAPLALEAPGEVSARFEIAAGNAPGNATVTVTAASDKGASLERTASLSIRPASPKACDVAWSALGETDTASATIASRLLPFENQTSLTVSTTALPLAHGLMRSLPQAAWNSSDAALCAAMPWASLVGAPASSLPKGDAADLQRDAAARIQKALETIESQLAWNGLSTWPWSEPSLMQTAWALDFALTLREQGRDVRPELVRRLVSSLGNALDNLTPETLAEGRTAAWALAQLTREGTLEAERIEALRNRMDARRLPWRDDPAALYMAYAYRLMRLTHEADALQKGAVKIDVSKAAGSDLMTIGGIPALAAAVRLSPSGAASGLLLKALESRPVESLSARERAFLASALLSTPADGSLEKKLDAVTLACTSPEAKHRPVESLLKGEGFVTLSAPGCTAFSISSDASLKGLFSQTTAEGWPAEPAQKAGGNGLEVVKRLLNEAGEPVSSVRAGDVVTVEIRARRLSGSAESPVVITDLFPGGFAPAATDERLEGLDVRQSAVSEDRLVGICLLNGSESTFTYRLRAQTQGQYTVPAVHAADGADPMIRAHDKSSTLAVTP